jgi:hypothetical protein
MKYNTARPQLRIPEYGRNVQKMAEFIKTLPTKEQRIQAANALIGIMANLNPQLKDQGDFRQKLWDHLYIIAGYELDVDTQYAPPPRPEEMPRPQKPSYALNHIKYRYYGKNVELMIKKAAQMEEGPMKAAFLNALASYMKMAYRVWNDDKVPDNVVIEHIREISRGQVELKEINEFATHNENYQQRPRRDQQQRGPMNKGGSGGPGPRHGGGHSKGPQQNRKPPFRKG